MPSACMLEDSFSCVSHRFFLRHPGSPPTPASPPTPGSPATPGSPPTPALPLEGTSCTSYHPVPSNNQALGTENKANCNICMTLQQPPGARSIAPGRSLYSPSAPASADTLTRRACKHGRYRWRPYGMAHTFAFARKGEWKGLLKGRGPCSLARLLEQHGR
eukprot:363203-Chlamydomonas_euryale.AAC.32